MNKEDIEILYKFYPEYNVTLMIESQVKGKAKKQNDDVDLMYDDENNGVDDDKVKVKMMMMRTIFNNFSL